MAVPRPFQVRVVVGALRAPSARPAFFGRTVDAVDDGDRMEVTARRRLRTLRQARGWTLDDLAARSHVGASTISRIETGQIGRAHV